LTVDRGYVEDTISGTVIKTLDADLIDCLRTLRSRFIALGDDVQEKTLQMHIIFKRGEKFLARVALRPSTGRILVHMKADAASIAIEPGFTRDVSQIGCFARNVLEIRLTKPEDLERAMPLIKRNYLAIDELLGRSRIQTQSAGLVNPQQ
jgi:predicted transport protein